MIKRNVGKIAIGTIVFMVVVVLALSVGLHAGDGENNASAKVTAQCGDLTIVTPDEGTWGTVLDNTIKCANQKDLFIDVSIVSSLVTQTRVKSKGGNEDVSMANAGIEVRVVIDGIGDEDNPDNWASPGVVVFAKRIQTLSAKLGGFGDPLTEEEIELILETMSANSFNFIVENVSSGVHMLRVQVRPSTDTSSDAGTASASAAIGHGSFTVEEVRCVKDDDIII